MSVPKFLFKGKTLDHPEVLKWANGTAQHDAQLTTYGIDSAQLHHLSLHVKWSQTTRFTSGTLYLVGSNIEEVEGPPIVPASVAGDGSLSGANVTLANQNDGNVIITYKDLPRWVKPIAILGGSGSMVGSFQLAAFGWMT